VFTSTSAAVNKFEVLDPDVNFSDHLPLFFSLQINDQVNHGFTRSKTNESTKTGTVFERRLRWDKADHSAYYIVTNFTGLSQEINEKLKSYKEGITILIFKSMSTLYMVKSSLLSVMRRQNASRVLEKNHYKFFVERSSFS